MRQLVLALLIGCGPSSPSEKSFHVLCAAPGLSYDATAPTVTVRDSTTYVYMNEEDCCAVMITAPCIVTTVPAVEAP